MKTKPEIAWAKLQTELPNWLKLERLKAKLMRERYIALLGEGFTEAQAVELCKDVLK